MASLVIDQGAKEISVWGFRILCAISDGCGLEKSNTVDTDSPLSLALVQCGAYFGLEAARALCTLLGAKQTDRKTDRQMRIHIHTHTICTLTHTTAGMYAQRYI